MRMIVGWLISCLASTITALPEVNFPVNAQVPTVARVSEAYSFIFTASTFRSSQGPLSYSVANSPSWLHLDNSTRRFYGTPETGDVGSSQFQLVATDLSGSSKMDVTFVTENGPALQSAKAAILQLARFGKTSEPDAFLLYPLQDFSFSFTRDIFSSSTNDVKYYATTDDASPLPSWLHFASQELRFFGTTPSLVNPDTNPQAYGIQLCASRIAGFAEAIVTFHIVIGYHILAFQNSSIILEVSQGDVSVALQDQLFLDGRPVLTADLHDVSANAPDWITFDRQNISLRGKVPGNANDANISVTAIDVYGDSATTVVSVTVMRLFTRPLPVVNATAGQEFNYTISVEFLRFDDTTVSANLSSVPSWLQYDDESRTLWGFVPENASLRSLAIDLHATRGAIRDDATLNILISRASESSSTTSKTSSPSETSTSTISTPSDQHTSRDGNKRTSLALVITLPVTFFILAAATILACWKRKRARREQREYFEKRDNHPRLVAQELDAEEISKEAAKPATPTKADGKQPAQPTLAPHVDLPWTESNEPSREHLSNVLTRGQSSKAVTHRAEEATSDAIGLHDISGQKHKQRVEGSEEGQNFTPSLQQTFNFSRKRLPFKSWQSRIEGSGIRKRYSRPTSGFSASNFGLPTRRSGAGHGSGGPPGFNEVRQSWQFTGSSMTSDESRIRSADLDKFPRPPPETKAEEGREIFGVGRNRSMRLINSNDAYAEFLRNRRRHRDLEPSARFSTMNSSRRFSDRRALNAYFRSSRSIRSRSDPEDYSTGDSANWRQTGVSQSSSEQPTLDTSLLRRSSSQRLLAGPSNARSAISGSNSGRFSSRESVSDSDWEDEFLIESQDHNGQRRWYTSEVLPEGVSPRLVSLETFHRNSRGQRGPLQARNPPARPASGTAQGSAPAAPSQGREWKLEDNQERQPVSVVEGQMQRSQGSEKGDVAFI